MNTKAECFKNKTILIVDDEVDLRAILRDEFCARGAKVREADGGDEAFRILLLEEIDLVISDIRMREGNGIELLSQIGALDRKRTPIILMTGFADITEKEAKAHGACAFFHKPFELHSLMNTVTEVLLMA